MRSWRSFLSGLEALFRMAGRLAGGARLIVSAAAKDFYWSHARGAQDRDQADGQVVLRRIGDA